MVQITWVLQNRDRVEPVMSTNGNGFLRVPDVLLRPLNPHGDNRKCAQSSDKHQENQDQLTGCMQIGRDSRGQSGGAEGGDNLKKQLSHFKGRFQETEQKGSDENGTEGQLGNQKGPGGILW